MSRGGNKLNADNPLSYAGTRTVTLTQTPCGHCLDALILEHEPYHRGCSHEIGYFDKLWVCGCDCNKDWVPQAVTVERGGAIVGSHTEPLPRPEESINQRFARTKVERETKAAKTAAKSKK